MVNPVFTLLPTAALAVLSVAVFAVEGSEWTWVVSLISSVGFPAAMTWYLFAKWMPKEREERQVETVGRDQRFIAALNEQRSTFQKLQEENRAYYLEMSKKERESAEKIAALILDKRIDLLANRLDAVAGISGHNRDLLENLLGTVDRLIEKVDELAKLKLVA